MNKIFWILFGIGLVFKLFLSITTYHSDLAAFALAAHYIDNQGKILDFYNLTKVENGTIFNYQPLAYLIPAAFYLPFSGLLSSTYALVQNSNLVWIKSQTLYWPLLMYKLPMVFGDLLGLYFLGKLLIKNKVRNILMLMWWFNPLVWYVSYMMGQIDVLIAGLVLGSYYFYTKEKWYTSVIFLVLSALIKPMGLMLIPLLMIMVWNKSKSLIRSGMVGFVGVLVYILSILPYYLTSPAYRYYAFMAEQINKSTFSGIDIASGTTIPWFFIALAFIVIYLFSKKISYLTAMITTILASLVFSHFHPQWLVWVTPLLLVLMQKKDLKWIWPALIGCWVMVVLSFDPSLHSELFLFSFWKFALPKALLPLVLMARAGLIGIFAFIFLQRSTSKRA